MKKLTLFSALLFSTAFILHVVITDTPESQAPAPIGKSHNWQQQFDEKAARKRAGQAKNEAPEMHAIMERARRTPFGEDEPDYPDNYLVNELSKLKSNLTHARMAENIEFQARGPGNVSGRTRGLLVDPDDPSHNTWFAGSASGGIWKTVNAGNSWDCISHDLPNLGTNTLAMSPANTSVIYAGTGEHFTNDIDGSGMFKSTDKGQSWTQVADPDTYSDFRNVSRIIVDPNNENIVLAATSSSIWGANRRFSIYRSTDGGTSWTRTYTNTQSSVDDLDFTPGNFDIQYAAQRRIGVIKSSDGGLTWKSASLGMQPTGRVEITVSPVNTNYVWASAQGTLSNSQSDLYLSKDAANSWSVLEDESGSNIDFLGGQGWYNNIITPHPYDANSVYVGGVNLFKFDLAPSSVTQTVLKVDNNTGFITLFNSSSFQWGNGTVGSGTQPITNIPNIEIRFGQGSQLAHRFTVDGRGSGVPSNDYQYQDYVEVPFQVWDTSNDQQLMVSFRDQQEDGTWNLLDFNLSENTAQDSREYLFIHTAPYAITPNLAIAQQGGLASPTYWTIWPYLTPNWAFEEDNLPVSRINVSSTQQAMSRVKTTVIADAYGSFNRINDFRTSDFVNHTGIHPDHHNIIAIKENEANETFRLLIGNDGGVYHSKISSSPGSTDGDFIYAASGFVTTQFYGADKAPGEDRYIGGMQDNSTWFTPSGVTASETTSYRMGVFGDGFEAIWNSQDPQKMIGSSQFNNFRRSLDGGLTWLPADHGLNDNGPFYSRLAGSRRRPNVIYTVGETGVWKSTDFGGNWTLTEISGRWSFSNAADIEVSYSNPDIIWAGGILSPDRTLYVSTNAGGAFTPVNHFPEVTGLISGIGSHPSEDSIAYALFSFAGRPKVLRTENLGDTWEDISGFSGGSSNRGFPDIAVNCIYVFPNNPNRIWVGSELGIIESNNAGSTWAYLNSNLPPVNVFELKQQDDQIVVATYGRGIWTITIPEIQQEIIFSPNVAQAGTSPSAGAAIRVNYHNAFDSVLIYDEGVLVNTILDIEAGNSVHRVDVRGYGIRNIIVAGYFQGDAYEANYSSNLFIPELATTSYFADFDNIGSIADFKNQGFTMEKSVNFADVAIHSPHPYQPSTTYQMTLRTPIIISKSAEVSYEDVAIVEPGAIGSEFGSNHFYDFVVVEGTKNGVDWVPFGDGYDSRLVPEWQNAYKTSQQGSALLYHKRIIQMQETFAEGDTVFIRYRMRSDQRSEGWGWAIDNIDIQTKPLETNISAKGTLRVWPNPVVTDEFNVTLLQGTLREVGVELYGMNGTRAKATCSLSPDQKELTVQRANLPAGIYMLKVVSGAEIHTSKVTLK